MPKTSAPLWRAHLLVLVKLVTVHIEPAAWRARTRVMWTRLYIDVRKLIFVALYVSFELVAGDIRVDGSYK
jgi:hypothetical protein